MITGASRGIGRETALLLAERGEYGRLILNCRKNAAELEETRRLALEAGAVEVIASVGDVGDSAYVESLLREHGPADAVVNNAGTAYFGLLTDMRPRNGMRSSAPILPRCSTPAAFSCPIWSRKRRAGYSISPPSGD